MNRARVRTRWRIHVRGVVFLVLLAAVGAAAVVKGNNLLFLVFSSLAGLFVSSVLLTVLTPRRLEIERRFPDSVHAGEPFELALRIRNGKRLLPAFALRFEDRLSREGRAAQVQPAPVHLPIARPGERVRASFTAIALQRGPARLGPVTVTAEFPPGFATCVVTLPVEDEMLVFPRRAVLLRRAVVSLLSRLDSFDLDSVPRVHGGEEFAGLREYRPGDSLRRIHWKMSARLPGRLLVREFEPARLRRAVILLETFVAPGLEARRASRLERAVSFTGALADELAAQGYGVGFRAFGPDPVRIDLDARRPSALDLQAALAALRPTRTRRIGELLEAEDAASDEVYFVLRIGDDPLPSWPGAPRSVVLSPAEIRASMRYVAREDS